MFSQSVYRMSLAALTLVWMLMLLVGSSSCSRGNNPGKLETLTIAAVPTELNATVYIAEDQKFFARNGLRVILRDYDSGATAAAGMLNGQTEIALAAEFPIVRQVFNKKDIINFGTMTKYENTFLIWRTDSGIKTIRDLKGKRIGVTLQTISEFYLGRTLQLNGMSPQQVTLIDTKAPDSEKAVLNGTVDAIATWEPWVTQIKERIGKGVSMQPLQGGQYAYWNLVTTTGWTKRYPDIMKRLLNSLAEAEDYIARYQDEAKGIVRKRMNFDVTYMETIWPRYQFALSFDQSLITAMEDEARWMIKSNLTKERSVPNFLDSISEGGLKAVKPEVVNIIR